MSIRDFIPMQSELRKLKTDVCVKIFTRIAQGRLHQRHTKMLLRSTAENADVLTASAHVPDMDTDVPRAILTAFTQWKQAMTYAPHKYPRPTWIQHHSCDGSCDFFQYECVFICVHSGNLHICTRRMCDAVIETQEVAMCGKTGMQYPLCTTVQADPAFVDFGTKVSALPRKVRASVVRTLPTFNPDDIIELRDTVRSLVVKLIGHATSSHATTTTAITHVHSQQRNSTSTGHVPGSPITRLTTGTSKDMSTTNVDVIKQTSLTTTTSTPSTLARPPQHLSPKPTPSVNHNMFINKGSRRKNRRKAVQEHIAAFEEELLASDSAAVSAVDPTSTPSRDSIDNVQRPETTSTPATSYSALRNTYARKRELQAAPHIAARRYRIARVRPVTTIEMDDAFHQRVADVCINSWRKLVETQTFQQNPIPKDVFRNHCLVVLYHMREPHGFTSPNGSIVIPNEPLLTHGMPARTQLKQLELIKVNKTSTMLYIVSTRL